MCNTQCVVVENWINTVQELHKSSTKCTVLEAQLKQTKTILKTAFLPTW